MLVARHGALTLSTHETTVFSECLGLRRLLPGELHGELRELVLNLDLKRLVLTDLIVQLLTFLTEIIDTCVMPRGEKAALLNSDESPKHAPQADTLLSFVTTGDTQCLQRPQAAHCVARSPYDSPYLLSLSRLGRV